MHVSRKVRMLGLFATVVALTSACEGRGGEDLSGLANERASVDVNYNQNDSRWACDQLGTCNGTTLGKCGGASPAGCAITALADVLESHGDSVDPGTLNDWLTNSKGYADGCDVRWDVAARHGGLSCVGPGQLTTPADLRALLDNGNAVIAKSSRFSEHWVAIAGYSGAGVSWSDFGYSDPWDATSRNVGDGWVSGGAQTRVFE